ncbi:hypothetical protein [Streptomonospora litoralis]|uniref:hypothetical protein n=1 Tax=Streptomonospora litoralis TaxID=2498135 RepID=UPI0010358908|nr:hypothetical protein [Streptomonospora litoralis]
MTILVCSRAARISALAAASPLLLAACGPDLDSMRSGPIPEEAPRLAEADLAPEPGDESPFAERVEWSIVESTSRFARTSDPEAKARCPEFSTREDSEIVCTVVFHGAEAKWDVTIDGGEFTVSSQMVPRGRQVVRETAENLLRHEMDTETVRCDMDKVHVVPVDGGEDKAVTCEWGRDEDSWKTSERQGTVRIQTSSPAAGLGSGEEFWFADAEG